LALLAIRAIRDTSAGAPAGRQQRCFDDHRCILSFVALSNEPPTFIDDHVPGDVRIGERGIPLIDDRSGPVESLIQACTPDRLSCSMTIPAIRRLEGCARLSTRPAQIFYISWISPLGWMLVHENRR
jgi:hypothetical protein